MLFQEYEKSVIDIGNRHYTLFFFHSNKLWLGDFYAILFIISYIIINTSTILLKNCEQS